MCISRNRRWLSLPAQVALAALLTLTPTAVAFADESTDGTEESWKKVLAYASCSIGIFIAVTPLQWGAALVNCAKMYVDEPRLTLGGV